MTDKPLKFPRVGATFFSLAMRDRALREAGLHDEADAAARRFEDVTGIDVLNDDESDRLDIRLLLDPRATAGMDEIHRKRAEVMRQFVDYPQIEPGAILSTGNRRSRRADATRLRRRWR